MRTDTVIERVGGARHPSRSVRAGRAFHQRARRLDLVGTFWWGVSGPLAWLTIAGMLEAWAHSRPFPPKPSVAALMFAETFAGAAAGTVSGLAQVWLLESRRVRSPAPSMEWRVNVPRSSLPWVACSTGGWAIGVLVAFQVPTAVWWLRDRVVPGAPPVSVVPVLALMGAVLAALIAGSEMPLLPKDVRRRWMVASVLSGAVGMALMPAMPRLPLPVIWANGADGVLAALPGLVFAGFLYGASTGATLVSTSRPSK